MATRTMLVADEVEAGTFRFFDDDLSSGNVTD